jgi:hypothetical protein
MVIAYNPQTSTSWVVTALWMSLSRCQLWFHRRNGADSAFYSPVPEVGPMDKSPYLALQTLISNIITMAPESKPQTIRDDAAHLCFLNAISVHISFTSEEWGKILAYNRERGYNYTSGAAMYFSPFVGFIDCCPTLCRQSARPTRRPGVRRLVLSCGLLCANQLRQQGVLRCCENPAWSGLEFCIESGGRERPRHGSRSVRIHFNFCVEILIITAHGLTKLSVSVRCRESHQVHGHFPGPETHLS